MGFTPGVIGSVEPWLNPKAGKLFRMAFAGHAGNDGEQSFRLGGANIVEGLRRTGLSHSGQWSCGLVQHRHRDRIVLAQPFDQFQFAGNTWSLAKPAGVVKTAFG